MDFWLRAAGNTLASAGAHIHDFIQDNGQKAGAALDAWGQHMGRDLDPSHPLHIAMTVTGHASFTAGRETLRCLDGFGQQTQKSVTEAYNHVSAVDWDKLSQEAKAWLEEKARDLGVAVAVATQNTVRIAEDKLPGEIVQWIAENPGQTTFIIVSGVVFFAPYLITVPVLGMLGFTAGGVAAGSAAAAMQSLIGKVQAGSIFALLQSAGAGGAGMAVVNGMVSGAAGVGIGAAAASNCTGKEDSGSREEKKEIESGESKEKDD